MVDDDDDAEAPLQITSLTDIDVTGTRLHIKDTLLPYKYASPTKANGSTTNIRTRSRSLEHSIDVHLPTSSDDTCATPSRKRTSSEAVSANLTPANSPTKRRLRTSEKATPPSTPHTPKKRAKPRPYAPPEKYEHLRYLQDLLEPYQKVVFCGINPGYQSGQTGLYYAHSTNHFWQCLHQSGLTEQLLTPAEAHLLPEVYKFGLTNLVDRPTAEQSELSMQEMKDGVPHLMDKLVKYRPHTLCFLGRAIWDIFRQQTLTLRGHASNPVPALPSRLDKKKGSQRSTDVWEPLALSCGENIVSSKYFTFNANENNIFSSSPILPTPASPRRKRTKASPPKSPFCWGLQPFKVVYPDIGNRLFSVTETLIFVLPSPSARVVAYQWWDKVNFFKQLKDDLLKIEDGEMDTSGFAAVPLMTTKSIYFVPPPPPLEQ